LTNIPLI